MILSVSAARVCDNRVVRTTEVPAARRCHLQHTSYTPHDNLRSANHLARVINVCLLDKRGLRAVAMSPCVNSVERLGIEIHFDEQRMSITSRSHTFSPCYPRQAPLPPHTAPPFFEPHPSPHLPPIPHLAGGTRGPHLGKLKNLVSIARLGKLFNGNSIKRSSIREQARRHILIAAANLLVPLFVTANACNVSTLTLSAMPLRRCKHGRVRRRTCRRQQRARGSSL